MEEVQSVRGARRVRLASRRRERTERYGRFIRLTVLGALIPGAGLIAAGRRRLGTALLTLLGLLILAAVAVAVLIPQSKLASYAGDRQTMLVVGSGLALVAASWLVVSLSTHHSLEPAGLSPARRLMGALAVMVATSVIVAPMAVGSKYAFTQRDLIGAISSNGASLTTPKIDEADPWADKPTLNVLLMGGDGGEGRQGVRPDSQIVASIDTNTGATTMISLPRNLQAFLFPDESPLADVYPAGFTGPGDPAEWMLNAVYRNVPAAHPELFNEVDNPGADATKWAVEGALGIDIDYYMLANLAGFEAIVNALGGITIDVPRDIPIGNKSLPGGGCTPASGYVNAGADQHLDGFHALWFARSRCGSDDYDRMERQRCVMNAIVAKADPATLLTQYQSLATATKDIVLTDIPEGLFPALIELTLKVKGSALKSLTLDNEFFAAMGTTSADPDYLALHTRIDEILERSAQTAKAEAEAEADGVGSGAAVDPTEQAPGRETSGSAAAESPVEPDEGAVEESVNEPAQEETRAPDEPVNASAVC